MQTMAVVVLGNWPRVFAALRALVAVLLVGIGVLLAGMLVYQMWRDAKARRSAALRRSVREAVGHMLAETGPQPPRAEVHKLLFSTAGLAEILHLTDEMTEEGCKALGRFLHQLGYEDFVRAQLDGSDPERLTLAVRLVARFGLNGLAPRLKQLLYVFSSDVALQYEVFLALCRLGSSEELVAVCMDESFVQKLSFRSLQQALGAYSGDAAGLYARLLPAPDPYIKRTCVKLIGIRQLVSLAGEVEELLQSTGDDNLRMDAIRCLGQLGGVGAAPQIAAFAKHPRWEVRALVATALGDVDALGHAGVLASMLCDAEWQVRYNAGLALQKAGLLPQVTTQVQATGDKFAMDMLRYMTQTAGMYRVCGLGAKGGAQ